MSLQRSYYSNSIDQFLSSSPDEVIGRLVISSDFSLEQTHRDACLEEIRILQMALVRRDVSIAGSIEQTVGGVTGQIRRIRALAARFPDQELYTYLTSFILERVFYRHSGIL